MDPCEAPPSTDSAPLVSFVDAPNVVYQSVRCAAQASTGQRCAWLLNWLRAVCAFLQGSDTCLSLPLLIRIPKDVFPFDGFVTAPRELRVSGELLRFDGEPLLVYDSDCGAMVRRQESWCCLSFHCVSDGSWFIEVGASATPLAHALARTWHSLVRS